MSTEDALGQQRRRGLVRLMPPPGPGRVLVTNSAVASIGNGLYMSGAAIYYVRVLGLTATQVGAAIAIGGVVALAASVPIGHWCDRVGAREAAMLMSLIKGALLIVASFVTGLYPVGAVVVALAIAEGGGGTCRGALVSGVMGRAGRVALSAYLRSVFNAGFTVGVLGAGIALAVDTRLAYQLLFWVNAVAMILVSAGYLRLPRTPRTTSARGGARIVDLPYLAVAQVAGLARIGPIALSIGLPLWLVQHTSAPRPLAAWLSVVNTAMVILFQVAASKGADSVRGAARLQILTFAVTAAACVVTALAAGHGPWAAAGILVAAVVLYSLAEIWGESARWGLRYELAPDHAQGAYGGLFSTGDALATVAGPLLVTALPEQWGGWGWGTLAAVFVAGSVASVAAVRWAVGSRSPATAV